MGSQHFSGSWGRNITGSVIRMIFINIQHNNMIVYEFVGKSYPLSNEHWSPTNNDDFTVYIVTYNC